MFGNPVDSTVFGTWSFHGRLFLEIVIDYFTIHVFRLFVALPKVWLFVESCLYFSKKLKPNPCFRSLLDLLFAVLALAVFSRKVTTANQSM